MRKLKLEDRLGGIEPLAVRIPQAAQMIGVGKSTLYELIASGEIETVKIGRSTLVLTEGLKLFVSKRRRPSQLSN